MRVPATPILITGILLFAGCGGNTGDITCVCTKTNGDVVSLTGTIGDDCSQIPVTHPNDGYEACHEGSPPDDDILGPGGAIVRMVRHPDTNATPLPVWFQRSFGQPASIR